LIAPAAGSLVAHWTLDASAADSGQFGFNGTPTGGVTFGSPGANANTGTSASFSNGSIDVSYDGMLNPDSFTLTAWARPTGGVSQWRSVVTSRHAATERDGYIIYAGTNNRWQFWTGNGGGAWPALDGGPVALNAWTHLAISFDAETNTKSFYVNGGAPVTTTAQGYKPNAHRDLHIGGGGDTGTQYRFVGQIDDMSLWNDALSLSEIQQIMNGSVPPQYAQQLVANFDIGTDPAFVGVGPFGGPNTAPSTFVKVNAQGADFTDNGITARVWNSTAFSTPNSPGSELTDDYLYDTGGGAQGNWRIFGLDPTALHDIYIVTSDGTGWSPTNIYGADYTITVGSADQTTLRATGGTTEAFADFVDGRDYVVFTNARPGPGGIVEGTYNQISGQPHTGIAGFQIVQLTPVIIPEPSTLIVWSLLAALGVGVGWRRRMR
jgi:hypothetical protein